MLFDPDVEAADPVTTREIVVRSLRLYFEPLLWVWRPVRRVWRRWFARFPQPPATSGHLWFTEDGQGLTTDAYIAMCKARGSEDWFFRERFHWQFVWPDGQRVSTVFMGLDHGFREDYAVLWETCVFGPLDGGSDVVARYNRRILAAIGHVKMVAIVQFYRLKAALRREPRLRLQTERPESPTTQG